MKAIINGKEVIYDVCSSEKSFIKAMLSLNFRMFKYIGKTNKILVKGFEDSNKQFYLFQYRKKYLHLRDYENLIALL